jgi:hypothetical protein
MIDPDLKCLRRTVRRDPKAVHDWRLPAGPACERVIDNFEWQLEQARDGLVTDLHRAASRLGCSHNSTAQTIRSTLSSPFTMRKSIEP